MSNDFRVFFWCQWLYAPRTADGDGAASKYAEEGGGEEEGGGTDDMDGFYGPFSVEEMLRWVKRFIIIYNDEGV